MGKMILFCVLAVVATGCTLEISDEEYAKFPRLYHLDDYSTCLAKTDGLYCLGSFHIQPPKQYDHTYELLKEYSSDPYHFNRTLIHRGYCVSDRCPSSERNTSLRFEHCAARWGRTKKLHLTMSTLKYCKTHAQEFARKENPEPYDLSQKFLLYIVAGLCLANVVGTLYDVLAGEGRMKKEVLAVWSIRSNWRRLTDHYEGGDPRLNALSPVQGLRVFLMGFIIGTHSGCIHDMLYLQNPQFVENVSRKPAFMIFMNGTSVVMVYVLISNFLLAYNLLLLSRTQSMSPSMLPYCLLKRIARITPVNLLVVGWAATLWPSMRAGPMWPTLVDAESKVCREKFWTHLFYVNNLVRPQDHCLVQTWFLATDMQLYIIACLLTLYLINRRRAALPVLALLTVASCVLNGALAYVFDWKSLMYHVFPSTLHTMYHDVPSFYRLYTAPWGSLPACLVGLFLAHLHFEMEERAIKPSDYRLFRWIYNASPPLVIAWMMAGNWLRDYTSPEFTAAYVGLERPVLSILAAIALLGMFNKIPGFYYNFFGWSGWHALGRMSLSVLMVHWIVNTCIAASRPQPISTSLLDVITDFAATLVLTYLAAVPMTLMVEMPVLRVVNTIFFKKSTKEVKQS